jgi:hypothetical protein
MEGTGFKSRGSFGIPEPVMRQMEESRRQQKEEEAEAAPVQKASYPPPQGSPEAPPSPPKEATPEEKDQLELLKTKRFWEEQLEVTLTPKDIRDYIFKGRLIKDGVFVASIPDEKDPEKCVDFKVTFQSDTPADSAEIDEKMAAYRDKGKYTAEGIANENALLVLSCGLLSADGRPLGKTPEERYKNIKNFGNELVNLIVESWTGFKLLLKISLREKKLLKKSSEPQKPSTSLT